MDPISPFVEMGLGLGAVIICTSLFIWNTIELRKSSDWKETIEGLTKELGEYRKVCTRMLDDQLKSQSKMVEQQAILANNQLNLTNAVSEVVRELISIIRDVEK
jgi:hypothetical protein